MSTEAMTNAMREELNQIETGLIRSLRNKMNALQNQPWANSQQIAGPAQKEARESTQYFHMGLSRKLLEAAMTGIPTSQAIPIALSLTAVLADRSNIDMLDHLLMVAYLRGVQKALDLTGQQIVTDSTTELPQTTAEQGEQSETTGEVCPHCGEVHPIDGDLSPELDNAFLGLEELNKIMSGGQFSALTARMAAACRSQQGQ